MGLKPDKNIYSYDLSTGQVFATLHEAYLLFSAQRGGKYPKHIISFMQMKKIKCALVACTKDIDLVQFGHASGFTSKIRPNVPVIFFRPVFSTHQHMQIAN